MIPPLRLPDDGDALDVVAVSSKEREVAPVAQAVPALKFVEHDEQPHFAAWDPAEIGNQPVLRAVELGLAQNAAHIQAVDVLSLALQARGHAVAPASIALFHESSPLDGSLIVVLTLRQPVWQRNL